MNSLKTLPLIITQFMILTLR